jgi:hypothetical protein
MDDSEQSTWSVGKQNRQLLCHTSIHLDYCKIPYERSWKKGTNGNLWSFKSSISSERNPRPLSKVWKVSLQLMTWTKTINSWWRLAFKLCSILQTVILLQKQDYVTYTNSENLKWKNWGINDITNEWFRYLPRRTLVHLTRLFNHGVPVL